MQCEDASLNELCEGGYVRLMQVILIMVLFLFAVNVEAAELPNCGFSSSNEADRARCAHVLLKILGDDLSSGLMDVQELEFQAELLDRTLRKLKTPIIDPSAVSKPTDGVVIARANEDRKFELTIRVMQLRLEKLIRVYRNDLSIGVSKRSALTGLTGYLENRK